MLFWFRYLARITSFARAIENWLTVTYQQILSIDTLPNACSSVLLRTCNLKGTKTIETFNVHQGKFGWRWLNVVLIKKLDVDLDDQRLKLSFGLRPKPNICVADTCHCCKKGEKTVCRFFLQRKRGSLLAFC